jgi:hypothetical protein
MNIEITEDDVKRVMDENPMFALQAKCMALLRMLEERDAELAALQSKTPIEPPVEAT